jgi:CBS domain-containing protein
MKHQSPPQAQEFMTRHVQTVTPDMSLEDVVRFLKEPSRLQRSGGSA